MHHFLILVTFLLAVISSSLRASYFEEEKSFLDETSLMTAIGVPQDSIFSHEDLEIKANDLFAHATSCYSYNPLQAAELYAQAGELYHQCLLLNGGNPPRFTYQSAILSSFRAGYYGQDYSPQKSQQFFTYCYHMTKNYVDLFENEISAEDIRVLIMIFNNMAYFFKKFAHLIDKATIAKLYIEAGNLGMLAFHKLQIENKASPLDYEKTAIAYYNAACVLREINLPLASSLYDGSAHLLLIRTHYKGNEATANDLRKTSSAFYNVTSLNNTLSEEQKFYIFRIILDLELVRLKKLESQVTPKDYDTIAKIYYNLDEQCSNAFSKIRQAQYFQKAAEYESIYLNSNHFNVSHQELLEAFYIYQRAAEIMRLQDAPLAQIFHQQAQYLEFLLEKKDLSSETEK